MTKKYNHILVPLDVSQLAELALDDAFYMAQLSGAELTLLQAVSPIERVLEAGTDHPIYVDERWAMLREEALDYLNSVCQKMECQPVTHTVVQMGSPAETIIDYAHEHPTIDLIVMATHGRSGLQRWVYGSVADKVLRGAGLPVLLVRAHQQPDD